MRIDRRHLLGSAFVGATGALTGVSVANAQASSSAAAGAAGWPAPSEIIALWPNGAPGSLNPDRQEVISDYSKDPVVHNRAIKGVSNPRLCVFPAADPTGGAMIIAPGGGYFQMSVDLEGYQVAAYLNSVGITAFVLFYRLPAEGWSNAADVPLMDAQRAMRIVRSNASRLKIDPKRVGFMGFSAGGHVCGSIMTRSDALVYTPVDAADTLSARPLLCAPIYPTQSMEDNIAHTFSRTNLLGKTPTPEQKRLYSPDENITKDTPPAFLVHSEVDKTVSLENTLNLRAALKAKGVTVETHLFAEGGHGFGMTKTDKSFGMWPQLFTAFARARGLNG